MFLHLSVSYCVHRGGGVCLSACWDIPTGQAPRPWADTPPCRRLLQRTVRILLECILVLIFFRPHRGRGLCMSLPFCLWSHVPSRGSLSLVPSVSGPMFLLGVCLSRGISVRETPRQRPVYGE